MFLVQKNSDKNGFNALESLCEKPLNQTKIYEQFPYFIHDHMSLGSKPRFKYDHMLLGDKPRLRYSLTSKTNENIQ